MIKARWFRITLLVCFIIALSISPCLALKKVVDENTKEAIVNKYLKGRALDDVEGIWYFTVNNYYGEVAVIKNPGKEYPGWDYLGVFVDSNTSGSIGDVKIALRKTDGKGVYTGLYMVQGIFGSSEKRTYFTLSSQNVLETRIPDLGWVSFVRITSANLGPGGGGGTAKGSSGTGFFVTPTLVITNEHVMAAQKWK